VQPYKQYSRFTQAETPTRARTIGYFAGFEDKDKKEFASKLMDF